MDTHAVCKMPNLNINKNMKDYSLLLPLGVCELCLKAKSHSLTVLTTWLAHKRHTDLVSFVFDKR